MGFFCSKRWILLVDAMRFPVGQQRGPLDDIGSMSPSGLPSFTALITTLKSAGLMFAFWRSGKPMPSAPPVLLPFGPTVAAAHTTLTSAEYVNRTQGLSCNGIHVRARIA